MKTIVIPKVKFVDYDESGRVILSCIICDTDKLDHLIMKDTHTLFTCVKDSVQYWVMPDYTITGEVTISAYANKTNVIRMLKVVKKLFDLGIIGNSTYIELRVYAQEKFMEIA